MNTKNIRKHMDVFASCGTRVGVVDDVEEKRIKLTRRDAPAGGKHHFIPMEWVESVEQHVSLNRNVEDALQHWETEPDPTAVVTPI